MSPTNINYKKETFIVSSENLVTNRKHREKWGAKIDSMREALIVTQQSIEKINNGDLFKNTAADDDVIVSVGPFEDALPDISQTSRVEGKEANADTVQLTVKLFLRENDREVAKQAIHQVEKMLRTEHIHNVYVTVPASDVQFIGMSAHSEDEVVVSSLSEGEAELSDGAARGLRQDEEVDEDILDPEREKYAMDLADLWNDLSKIKAVESLGLCDVETDVFKRIYQEAHKKTEKCSSQLEELLCCAASIKQFAATKKIKLLTHSDSPEILGDSFCNEVAGFGAGDHGKTWKPLWIVRFQIFKELRGILEDR